jgi:serine/threonine protein kinase
MTISAGTRLSHYGIRSKIGEGGMGEVYLAEDTKLLRSVALKILPVDIAANKNRMHRFLQEAQAAAAPLPLIPTMSMHITGTRTI